MTPKQEQQLHKLIEYVKELAQQHNALEQKVEELEAKLLSVPVKIEVEYE
jgi:phage shock protein A